MNDNEKYYVQSDQDFHMNGVIIKKEDLSKKGIFTLGKDSFVSFDGSFIDDYLHIRRKAQIITLKDLGPIISYTGLNRESIVMSAGAGSGAVGCFLGKIASRVDEYDIDDENIEIAKKNVENLNLTNVTISKSDVYDKSVFTSRKDTYDLFVLDVPEPLKALNTASLILKVGGYLAIYCPSISQIQETVKALPENLSQERTVEIIERDWSVKEKVLRPVTKDFGHTGFICFVRKIF